MAVVALAGCGSDGDAEPAVMREASATSVPTSATISAPTTAHRAPTASTPALSSPTTAPAMGETEPDVEPVSGVSPDPTSTDADDESGGGTRDSVTITDSVTLRVFDPED